uniref:Uncharacterized protein n=1 Tax=Timema genevievae TaxID=629358 RepID=A0A7R9K2D1_TIMGE|nr:unnamed protein product [Timema genevievae]
MVSIPDTFTPEKEVFTFTPEKEVFKVECDTEFKNEIVTTDVQFYDSSLRKMVSMPDTFTPEKEAFTFTPEKEAFTFTPEKEAFTFTPEKEVFTFIPEKEVFKNLKRLLPHGSETLCTAPMHETCVWLVCKNEAERASVRRMTVALICLPSTVICPTSGAELQSQAHYCGTTGPFTL